VSTTDDTPEAPTPKQRPWPNYLGAGLALTVMVVGVESLLMRQYTPGAGFAWVGVLQVGLLVLPAVVAAVLLFRRIKTGKHYPWLAFSVGAALPWLLFLVLFHGPAVVEYLGRRDFNSEGWMAAVEPPDGLARSQVRIKMVDDLVESGILDGKPRFAVEALLGPDDARRGAGGERYWLGTERVLGLDSEWLRIEYGADDRVRRHRVVSD